MKKENTIFKTRSGRASQWLLLFALILCGTKQAWAMDGYNYLEGCGTSDDPYLIRSEEDWEEFCTDSLFMYYRSKYIKLMCSFTTNTVVTSEYYFAGNFDGNGYTITLDYTLGGISTGLFRYVDCPDNYPTPVIKNLNVAGTITATVNTTPEHDGIGAIVGKLGRGTLQNCTSSVTIIDNGHTLKHVGGLVGALYQATVIDCAFTGSLNCDHSYDAIGGIVGYASYEHNFVIKNCLSTGNITVMSSTNTYAGGILGYVRDNSHTSNSKNNYWLSNGVNQTNGGGGAIGGASKTDAEMKSGQVSRLLNGGDGSTENADGAWGNTVGSNYPSLGGPTVYKVSFDANGGSGSMSDAYIHASPLPANLFTAPEGCSFKSWSTSANGNFVSSISSDDTLYAIWQVIAVNYIDVDGSSQSVSATPLLSEMTMLPDGWYVVNKDVTISSRVSCLGHVKLILADGKTFTASKGIGVNRYNTEEQEEQEVAGGISAVSLNTLTIYGQSAQTGALTAGGTLDVDGYFAGIGGDANKGSGLITINGGIVTANGGEWAAGIGSGFNRTGTVTINGGTVTANGGERAAGIGSGYRGNCVVTISGGTVTANGGEEAAGIGGGCRNIDDGTVTISGGNINATAGSNASAIGSGYDGYGVTITITGGNFATGDVEGNTVYGIAPAAGYAVYSSGNTTYPYAVVKNPTKDIAIAGYDNSTSGGWYLIASPLPGTTNVATVANLINTETPTNYDLYRFNQTATKEWENYKAHHNDSENPFNALVSGQGYLYANAADVTLTFTGAPYSGNGEVTLHKTPGARFEGWNLIGNPFGKSATINKAFYRMNPENHAEIIVADNYSVAAMEGIFVVADTDGETVTFAEATRGGESDERIIINLSNNTALIDRAIIRFDEGQTLPKFQIRENSTKIYIPQDGKDYAIANIGTDVARNVSTEMPVNFKANENGTYTLSFNAENVEMNYLHLIDNMTGANVDLLANPSYTFNAKVTDYESRFKLVFGASTGSASEAPFAFISDENLIVNGTGTLQVFDMLGHQLLNRDIHSAFSIPHSAFPAGLYVLRLINGNDVKTQKIVVR